MAAGGREVGRGDDGAAVVEFALILPLLVVLMLGMFTGAMAWNQSQALGQGARVAGRYGATLPLATPIAPETAQAQANARWLDELIDRAVTASGGDLGSGVPGRIVCVAYVDPAGASADQTIRRRLLADGTRTAVDATPCFTDDQDDTDKRVQVSVERDGYIDTGLYRFPLTMRRTAVYRYEADGGL